ncbi:hypothetical protein PR048_021349 [Dryococelus australis]|uniref:Uncharacterized protein n=1 Tax=Dryococelus australis TaxID=614101 RepID=A0ABQ9GXY1_9NEOP|nr:hypothetical protein PR048_021349 [Dryococelus australis]
MATTSDDFAHVEKLVNHSNISICKFQVVVLFKATDVYDVITTTIEDAAGKDKDWIRKDAKAQRYIMTTTDKGNIQFSMSCKATKEMFKKLCSNYERDSSQNKSMLLQSFSNYKIEDVATGFSELQNLSVRLKSVGHTIDDGKNSVFATRTPETQCETCLRLKQTRKPSGKERERVTRPLEIIHTDACGQLDTTWDGFKYFLTFLDDYPHFAILTLIKNKSDVFEATQAYVAQVELAGDVA